MGVVIGDLGAAPPQELPDRERRALAGIIDVSLVGHAEEQDAAAVKPLAELPVERLGKPRHDMERHHAVDLAGKLDEAGGHVELPRFPGEVEGIDGNAVAAESGPGPEGHEAEGLGRRRLDDLEDVDVHALEEKLEFVDEGDVDGPEHVLGDLGRLCDLRRGDRHDPLDESGIEGDRPRRRLLPVAAYELRDLRGREVGIAGILPFGTVGEVEIHARSQPRTLEQGFHHLARGAGVGRGFEDHELARPQSPGDLPTGPLDEGEIGLAVRSERGRHADRKHIGLAESLVVRARLETARATRCADAPVRNVTQITAIGMQRRHLGRIHIQTEHLQARFGRGEGERQPYIAEADGREEEGVAVCTHVPLTLAVHPGCILDIGLTRRSRSAAFA